MRPGTVTATYRDSGDDPSKEHECNIHGNAGKYIHSKNEGARYTNAARYIALSDREGICVAAPLDRPQPGWSAR